MFELKLYGFWGVLLETSTEHAINILRGRKTLNRVQKDGLTCFKMSGCYHSVLFSISDEHLQDIIKFPVSLSVMKYIHLKFSQVLSFLISIKEDITRKGLKIDKIEDIWDLRRKAKDKRLWESL